MTAMELLQKYVLLHNHGVETGDFSAMLELFADDAVFEFEDPRIGAFEGIKMIAGVFRRQPPDFMLAISNIKDHGDFARADYGDEAAGGVRQGSITLDMENGWIKRLFIEK
jgi:hypothetical protein